MSALMFSNFCLGVSSGTTSAHRQLEPLARKARVMVLDTNFINAVCGLNDAWPQSEARPFDLGMPFETVWLEPLELGMALCTAENAISGLSVITGLLVHSNDPSEYEIVTLHIAVSENMKIKRGEPPFVVPYTIKRGDSSSDGLHSHTFVSRVFAGLSLMGQLGLEKVNEKIRIGRGAERSIHKIKELVHVRIKPRKGATPQTLGRDIDWSHRWEVMGHWRRVAGLGKDPSGNYTVRDFTWVTPHEKGPEAKPMIKKIRLVSMPDFKKTGSLL